MSATAFNAIEAAFVAVLSQAPAVSSTILRAEAREVAEQNNDAVNVYFAGSVPNRGVIQGAPVDWQSRIVVECSAKSATQAASVAVDALVKKVYARLAADPSLGDAADDIGEPEIEAEYENNGHRIGWVKLTYLVLHRTSNSTLD